MRYIPKFQTGTPKKDLFEGLNSLIGQKSYVVPDYIEDNHGNCIGSACMALQKIGVDIPIIPGNSNFWDMAQRGKIPIKVYATNLNEVKATLKNLQKGDVVGHDYLEWSSRNGYFPEHAQIVYNIIRDDNGYPITIQMLDGYGDSYDIKEYSYDSFLKGGPYGNMFIGRPIKVNGADNPVSFGGILTRNIPENIEETASNTWYEFDKSKLDGLTPFQIDVIKGITSVGSEVKKDFMSNTGISNDKYDKLVNLLVGIAGQESNYGVTTSEMGRDILTYGTKSKLRTDYEQLKDFAAKLLKKEGPSRGPLQIKDKNIFNYKPTRDLVSKFGISKENYDPNDLRQNTIVALALLDHIDLQQLPGFDKEKKYKTKEFIGKKDNAIARLARSNYRDKVEVTSNNPDMSYLEKMIYMYNRPSTVAKGKAEGKEKNKYVNSVIEKSKVVFPQTTTQLTLPTFAVNATPVENQTPSNEVAFNSEDFNVPNYIYKQGGTLKAQKGTIVTNNPNDPRIKAFKDSLNLHNLAHQNQLKTLDRDIDEPFKPNEYYKYTVENGWGKEEVRNELQYEASLVDGLTRQDFDNVYNSSQWDYFMRLKKIAALSRSTGINPDGYYPVEGYLPAFKKPIQPVVYEPFVNRITPKGLPTSTQPIPQMLNMPDRIEMDSRTGTEYKGINVSHYTDALGRYTAKLNKTTTPGVRGRISYKDGGIIYAQKGKKLPPLPLFETNKTAFVDSVLDANKNIEWVKRLYGPQKNNALYNIIPGQISTHLMGHNGKGLVFPHIVKDNGKLKYLETDDSAEEYAKQNNTGIQFKTPEQAAWFSADGYKMGTGVFGKNLKPNRLL